MTPPGSTRVLDPLGRILARHLSPMIAQVVLRHALQKRGLTPAELERTGVDERLAALLRLGIQTFCREAASRDVCLREVRQFAQGLGRDVPRPVTVEIVSEDDVVAARTQARRLAESVGFDHTAQVKLATVISELARNIIRYAGTGRVMLEAELTPVPRVRLRAEDHGPGIPNLEQILAGHYQSKTGLGLGLLGCRRLLDEFSVDTRPGQGTRIAGSLNRRT
jgi:serine/threonine-protein kinase RsbT